MYHLPRSLTLRQAQQCIRPFNNFRSRARLPRIQSRLKSEKVYYQAATGEPVRYQSVRFKKPGLTLRRIATIGIYTGVVYGNLNLLLRYMDVEIEFLDDDEEGETEGLKKGDKRRQRRKEAGAGAGALSSPDTVAASTQDTETGEEQEGDGPPFYADDSSTFIPLTWSTKLPRTYYRGSDPEWQEFVKIARDKSRHKKVQDELVQIVYTGCTQHPTISRQLGRDTKVGKYWLDISFPDGPPQEYERSGIEIGEGFVAWSQQKVSQESQGRVMRALWPQAVGRSSWATVKVLAGIQWRRAKQALGLEEANPMAPEERFKTAIELAGKRRDRKEVGKAPQTEPDGRPGAVVNRNNPAGATPSSTAGSSNTSDGSHPRASNPTSPEEGKSIKLPWLPSIPLPSSPSTGTNINTDLPIAIHVFQSTLQKSWNGTSTPQPGNAVAKIEPPRGAFVVQGLVEVRGQRGRMLFDVQSAYDPKAGKYVQVQAGVRGFKRWSQAPRGGP
ncbi:hypothetical protein LTR37_003531 [Vermiconidia calcicola]|uniref:Uncharacterized protein n=1 Tax=Vermiconidia calcicola TaxID=1690605 RepID=A0ACC3NQ51_9PEZI|nr:hypothetical protein LTR37_003531 [Vermiconidia calcicola]